MPRLWMEAGQFSPLGATCAESLHAQVAAGSKLVQPSVMLHLLRLPAQLREPVRSVLTSTPRWHRNRLALAIPLACGHSPACARAPMDAATISTAPGARPQCSHAPRPCAPSTPSASDSSTTSLYLWVERALGGQP
jgi:hypothetical protein